jgi:hypothetical protein
MWWLCNKMLMPVYTPLKVDPAATLNFVGFTASGSAGSTLEDTTQFSYSSISVGSNEGADRIILVASVTTGGGAGTDGISSMTCGGVSGTNVFENLGTDHMQIAIFRFAIASGTSKDIVVNYQRSTKRGGIYVYEGTNLTFINSSVTTRASGSGSLTSSASFDIAAGQAVMGFSVLANGETRETLTFTNLTERIDVGLGPDAGSESGAGTQTGCGDATFASASAGQSFSIVYDGQALRSAAFVVFGPA